LHILSDFLVYYLLLAVENVQNQKTGRKMTEVDESDLSTQRMYKPEDALKLVMTAGEEPSQKGKPNHSPLNRTRLTSKQLQAGKSDECEHNLCMHVTHASL